AGGPVHVGDEQGRTIDPDLPAAWAVEVRYEGGIGLAWHATLRKWVGSSRPERPVEAQRRPAGPHASLTVSPAASRPHFLNRWKHFNAGSSLAMNRMAGCLGSPLACSNQEPPGTAKLSNASHSNRLPSMIECPLP